MMLSAKQELHCSWTYLNMGYIVYFLRISADRQETIQKPLWIVVCTFLQSASITSMVRLHQRKDAILILTPSRGKFQKYGGRVDNHIVERLWYTPGLVLGDTFSLRRMAETVLWSMAILWGLLWMDSRVDLHLVVLYCLLLWKFGTRRSRYITGETNDQGYLQRWVKSSEADSPVSPWSLGGKHLLIKTIGQ